MKTLEQIQKEIDIGHVIPSSEFQNCCFNGFDGEGYYHDGNNETEICVWEDLSLLSKYPYVIWYNK